MLMKVYVNNNSRFTCMVVIKKVWNFDSSTQEENAPAHKHEYQIHEANS